jgi:putative nucleotidyltransferase with HDIG domain
MSSSLMVRPQVADRIPLASIRQTVLAELERVEGYPTLSDTTLRAMALVQDKDASTAEVAGLIHRDSVLAAAVLRQANNWMYRGKKEVDDIQQAVLRLGLTECSKLLCTMGLRVLSKHHDNGVKKRCEAILRHSLFVAHLATGISRKARLEYAGVEFTAGLLHDIGRVVACVKAPLDFAVADPIDFNEDGDFLQRERLQMGIDHCAIGYQFATKNNLPDGIVRAILNHHRPEAEQFQQELVALISVADRVANFVQREHNIAAYNLSECPYYSLLTRTWAPIKTSEVCRTLPALVVQSIRETRQMLKTVS